MRCFLVTKEITHFFLAISKLSKVLTQDFDNNIPSLVTEIHSIKSDVKADSGAKIGMYILEYLWNIFLSLNDYAVDAA